MAALSNWLAGLLRIEMQKSWKPMVTKSVVAVAAFGMCAGISEVIRLFH